MNTIKTALKIGAGLVVFGAVTGAVATYWATKRYASTEFDMGDIVSADSNPQKKRKRKAAFNGIVQAGRDMKDAWNRIQENAKVITNTAMGMDGEGDEANQEESGDDEEVVEANAEPRRARKRPM